MHYIKPVTKFRNCRCLVWALALIGSTVGTTKADDSPTRPKPEVPQLAEKSGDATAAIGSFKKPNGYSCELFAAEPMVGNPVAFTIDHRGRVVVCETYRQGKGVTALPHRVASSNTP